MGEQSHGTPPREETKTLYRRGINKPAPTERRHRLAASKIPSDAVIFKKKKNPIWGLLKKEQLEGECLTDGNFHLNNFLSLKIASKKEKK